MKKDMVKAANSLVITQGGMAVVSDGKNYVVNASTNGWYCIYR